MSRKRCLILAISLLSLMAISGPVGATEPAVDPDTSVSVENASVAPEGAGATPIQPDPTVTNPRPHTWDRIVVSSDGLMLDIYFWMGIEECNGLHSVTVSPTDNGIDVALQTGTPAGAEDMVCIEIAQVYVTSVTLEQPLIGNSG
jgi:hypothetical protein